MPDSSASIRAAVSMTDPRAILMRTTPSFMRLSVSAVYHVKGFFRGGNVEGNQVALAPERIQIRVFGVSLYGLFFPWGCWPRMRQPKPLSF